MDTMQHAHSASATTGHSTRQGWRRPADSGRERRAIILALFVGVPLLFLLISGGAGAVHPLLAVTVGGAMLGIAANALVSVSRIPRLLLSGLIGGGAAGLIAIGAGMRLAMRIVALSGGRREVTIDGTIFLFIFGAMVGAFIGVVLAAMLRVWKVRGVVVGAVLGVFPGGGFLLEGELRAELLDEGLGGWMNIPMFLAIFPLFGLLLVPVVRRVHDRLPRAPSLMGPRSPE